MSRTWSVTLVAGFVAVATVAVAAPAAADLITANTVSVDSANHKIVYAAGALRTNQLVVSNANRTKIKFVDLSGITPGPGCVAGANNKEAICTVDPDAGLLFEIKLGNMNDSFDAVGSPPVGLTILDAGTGNDHIDFGIANGYLAIVMGGLGSDTLTAAATSTSNLTLIGGGGADTICGGSVSSADYSSYSTGVNVSMNGVADDGPAGEGDNVCATIHAVIGSGYNDTITGGPGNDFVDGSYGNDAVSGGGGNDIVYGGDGADYVLGNEGDDFVYGSDGADFQDGGPGFDECSPDADDIFMVNCEF